VFDSTRRLWIVSSAASAGEIANVIAKRPVRRIKRMLQHDPI
jgi:hypothetical protein